MTTVLADGSTGAADVAVASHTGQRRVRPSADAAHEAHITWLQGRLRAIAAGLEGHTAHCICEAGARAVRRLRQSATSDSAASGVFLLSFLGRTKRKTSRPPLPARGAPNLGFACLTVTVLTTKDPARRR